MAPSRVSVLFAITFCTLTCLCANAGVSKAEAKKAVLDAQRYTKYLFQKSREIDEDSTLVLRNSKMYVKEAQHAAITAAKRAENYPAAGSIARQAKKAASKVIKLFPNAFEHAKRYRAAAWKVVSKGKNLAEKANKYPWGGQHSNKYYTKMKQNAQIVKAEAIKLEKEIQFAIQLSNKAYSAQIAMPELTITAQLKMYYVEAIVIVGKTDPLVKAAEADFALIEKKRDEVSSTVQEMKKLCKKSPKNLLQYITSLHSFVEDNLRSVSNTCERAKKMTQALLVQKDEADDSLEKVRTETIIIKAKGEVEKAKWYSNEVAQLAQQIKELRQSAETYAFNANARKESAIDAINKKEKPKYGASDNGTKESSSRSGRKQQTETNTDKNEKDTDGKSGNRETEKKVQPMNPTAKRPSYGGTMPNWGDWRDSAMTVSPTLLIALIACVALHG